MTQRDQITFRQYSAVAFAAMFSPVSRLLPKAVLELAGYSGWISTLLAYFPLLGLMWLMDRFLYVNGCKMGMAEAFQARLGRWPGKVLTAIFGFWIVVYGGFLLRSGVERLLSTVYPTANMYFFLCAMMAASAVAAMGKLRYAVRSSVVVLILFALALFAVYVLALPNVTAKYLLPVEMSKPHKLALGTIPVVNVLSPWVYFSFLRGSVVEDHHALKRSGIRLGIAIFLVFLLLVTTIGILGPELSLRQQFPFFVMIKNLTLFNVMERFEPVVVVIWGMTDYACITMLLLSAATAFHRMAGKGKRQHYTLPCIAGMLAVSFFIAPDAFQFVKISNVVVPAINMCFVSVILPLLWLISIIAKKLKKLQIRC